MMIRAFGATTLVEESWVTTLQSDVVNVVEVLKDQSGPLMSSG
jgi:hypothetical protein